LWLKNAKFGFLKTPEKMSDFLILGRREGVKKCKKNSLFLFPYSGEEGVQVNKDNFFFYALFY